MADEQQIVRYHVQVEFPAGGEVTGTWTDAAIAETKFEQFAESHDVPGVEVTLVAETETGAKLLLATFHGGLDSADADE